MFQIPILDLIIAVVFIYFLFSLLATLITEIIVGLIQKRGKLLKFAFDKILENGQHTNWAERIYEHPLIATFQKKEGKLPTYISAQTFSTTLIDLFINESKEIKFDSTEAGVVKFSETLPFENTFENFKVGVAKIPKSQVKNWIETFLHNSQNIDELKANIEKWYDEYMGRVSGWYKMYIRQLLWWVSIPIVLVFNINTIQITQTLIDDDSLRDKLVEQAIQMVRQDSVLLQKHLTQSDSSLFVAVENKIALANKVYEKIKTNNLPIGWTNAHTPSFNLCKPEIWWAILGWFLSVFAIQRGSPFWFDVLNNLVNMRNAGKKP